MDPGLFLSNGNKKIYWLLGPVLFLIIFYFPFFTYFKSVNDSLRERRSFVESMPIMTQKISMAKTMLEDYKPASTKAEAMEMLNSQLNQIAQRNNFTINSLVVENEDKNGSEVASIFKVAIEGEGTLAVIMRFFNEIQSPERLFVVETTNIRTIRLTPESFFNAEFIFYYYNLQ